MLPGMQQGTPDSNMPGNDQKGSGDGNLFDEVDRFEIWFASAWPKLIWVAVGIIIALLVVISVNMYRTSERENAALSLYDATKLPDVEKRLEALESTIQHLGTDPITLPYRFVWVQLLIDQKKYDVVLEKLEEISLIPGLLPIYERRIKLIRAKVEEIRGNLRASGDLLKELFESPDLEVVLKAETGYMLASNLLSQSKKSQAIKVLQDLSKLPEGIPFQYESVILLYTLIDSSTNAIPNDSATLKKPMPQVTP